MSPMQAVYDKAAVDPAFRARLISDPGAILKAAGVEVPAGKTVEVIEGGRNELHLFLGDRSIVPEVDRVLERAGKDVAFKEKLTSNPKGTLEEAFGQKLPPAVAVHLHEPAPNRMRLLLPAQVAGEGELSDLELEAVAGGGLWVKILNALCRNETTSEPIKHYQLDGNAYTNTTTNYSGETERGKEWS